MTVNQIAGILPALVFPAATLAQLVRMIRTRSAADVSVATWLLFGFANLAIYIYAERYTEWQAILGMLVTAALDFAIVVMALAAFRRERFVTATSAAAAVPSPLDFGWHFDSSTCPVPLPVDTSPSLPSPVDTLAAESGSAARNR